MHAHVRPPPRAFARAVARRPPSRRRVHRYVAFLSPPVRHIFVVRGLPLRHGHAHDLDPSPFNPLPIPIPTRGHRRCSSHRAAVIAHQPPPPPSRHFKSASSWCIEKVTTNAQKHTGCTSKARDHGGKSACGAQCPRKPTVIPPVIPPFMTPLLADRLVIPPIRRRRGICFFVFRQNCCFGVHSAVRLGIWVDSKRRSMGPRS